MVGIELGTKEYLLQIDEECTAKHEKNGARVLISDFFS